MAAEPAPSSVVSYVQTCRAAPSQWEGVLDDGRMFYVRFRRGQFRVSVSTGPTTDPMEAVRGPGLLEDQIDVERDGLMDEEEMRQRTAAVLDFSGAVRLEFEH